uniref:Uncharacterized protein n=1 Tax=Arundo donax TaxID=35708 RepID=A0A0A9G010_ARUDO
MGVHKFPEARCVPGLCTCCATSQVLPGAALWNRILVAPT